MKLNKFILLATAALLMPQISQSLYFGGGGPAVARRLIIVLTLLGLAIVAIPFIVFVILYLYFKKTRQQKTGLINLFKWLWIIFLLLGITILVLGFLVAYMKLA